MSLKHFISTRHMSRPEVIDVMLEAMRHIPDALNVTVPGGVFDLKPRQLPPKFTAVFTEKSTGTLQQFTEAAQLTGCRIGEPIIGIEDSSLGKGESLKNTMMRLYHAGTRFVGIRSTLEGVSLALAEKFDSPFPPEQGIENDLCIFNGGDGKRNHPSQVLMDLLCIVCWILFRESIQKGNSHFVEAVDKFLRQSVESQQEQVAQVIDTLRIAFVGDLRHSRVTQDWLNLGRGKFKISYHLVAPDFASLDPHLLRDINATTSTTLTPEAPATFFYFIRWQMERLEKSLDPLKILEVYRETHCSEEFLDKVDGWVMDALPIAQKLPSIPPELQSHRKVIVWFQSKMGIPLRMALFTLGHKHRTDLLQRPRPHQLHLIKIAEMPLEEQQARYRKKAKQVEEYARGLTNGTAFDHLPPEILFIFYLLLKRAGVLAKGKGARIWCEGFESEKMPGHVKESVRLAHCFPSNQILGALALVAPTMTVNIFNQKDDKFSKNKVPLIARVFGLFDCPAADTCITGRYAEAEVESLFHISGAPEHPIFECHYCHGVFTLRQMIESLDFARWLVPDYVKHLK